MLSSHMLALDFFIFTEPAAMRINDTHFAIGRSGNDWKKLV